MDQCQRSDDCLIDCCVGIGAGVGLELCAQFSCDLFNNGGISVNGIGMPHPAQSLSHIVHTIIDGLAYRIG